MGQTSFRNSNNDNVVAVDALSIGGNTLVGGATFSIGAEAGNAITVGVQLTDGAGNDLAAVTAVHFYLSGNSGGDGAVAAATSLAAGTDGAMIEYVSNSAGLLISEADGDVDVAIGDASGAATYYLVIVLPSGGLVVSDAITFAA